MKGIVISFIIFLVLAFASLASSSEISISPLRLKFKGFEKETICKSITINSDSNVTCNEKWSLNYAGKELKKYNLTSKDLEISNKYLINGNESQICFIADRQGEYHGVLLCKAGNAGIGIWLNVSIEKNEKFSERIFLTGASVAESVNKELLPLSLVVMVLLLGVLLFLLVKRSKRMSKKIPLYFV